MYLIKPPTKFKEFNFAGRPYAGTTAGANLRTSNGLQTERIDSSQFKAHRMPDFSSIHKRQREMDAEQVKSSNKKNR